MAVGQTLGSRGGGLKQSFVTALSATHSFDAEGVGTHRYENGNWYKWVRYRKGVGSIAAVVGDVAYYYLAGGAQDDDVTSDLSDSVNIGAGVLQAIIADLEFGWVQIKGKAVLTTALTAGADGNALTPVGSTDGTLDVSAAVTDAICAYADDASAKEILCDFPW